jgi:hypothetical protein
MNVAFKVIVEYKNEKVKKKKKSSFLLHGISFQQFGNRFEDIFKLLFVEQNFFHSLFNEIQSMWGLKCTTQNSEDNSACFTKKNVLTRSLVLPF